MSAPQGSTEASQTEVEMIHYVCDVCSMSATCVHNMSSDLAWLDHMDNHGAKEAFRVYTWAVLAIPFDPTAACV